MREAAGNDPLKIAASQAFRRAAGLGYSDLPVTVKADLAMRGRMASVAGPRMGRSGVRRRRRRRHRRHCAPRRPAPRPSDKEGAAHGNQARAARRGRGRAARRPRARGAHHLLRVEPARTPLDLVGAQPGGRRGRRQYLARRAAVGRQRQRQRRQPRAVHLAPFGRRRQHAGAKLRRRLLERNVAGRWRRLAPLRHRLAAPGQPLAERPVRRPSALDLCADLAPCRQPPLRL